MLMFKPVKKPGLSINLTYVEMGYYCSSKITMCSAHAQ